MTEPRDDWSWKDEPKYSPRQLHDAIARAVEAYNVKEVVQIKDENTLYALQIVRVEKHPAGVVVFVR